MKRLIVLAFAAVLALTGCTKDEPRSPLDGVPIRTVDFDQKTKDRVAKFADAKDCDGLQDEFDQAHEDNNADLMRWVDDTMRDTGCYG